MESLESRFPIASAVPSSPTATRASLISLDFLAFPFFFAIIEDTETSRTTRPLARSLPAAAPPHPPTDLLPRAATATAARDGVEGPTPREFPLGLLAPNAGPNDDDGVGSLFRFRQYRILRPIDRFLSSFTKESIVRLHGERKSQ